jgi:hypothetical protein
VDAFGTDDVTFITLLKGNWFLGILLSHKPFLLDRCTVSGSLVGIPRWLPVHGFEALHSALQARKQVCSYLSLVHDSLKIFDLAFWCFGTVLRNLILSDDKAKMGCITGTCKRVEQVFPLSNMGAQISHWTFPAYPDISSSIQTTDPLGRYLGGGR